MSPSTTRTLRGRTPSTALPIIALAGAAFADQRRAPRRAATASETARSTRAAVAVSDGAEVGDVESRGWLIRSTGSKRAFSAVAELAEGTAR